MQQIICKDMTITPIKSTVAIKDAGPVFGPVVKPVWTRYYPHDDQYNHQSEFTPLLIQYNGLNYLIDTGYNTTKFDQKLFRNTGVQEENQLQDNLARLNLTVEDIDVVLMTHMHNDHANGLTYWDNDQYHSTFPHAKIYVSETEWHNVRHPHPRQSGTYLRENWEQIASQVITFKDNITIAPGIEMIQIPGHTEGIAMVKLTQGDETYVHVSDLVMTSANVGHTLWVSAFDDYPMIQIETRNQWIPRIFEEEWKMLFYHDPYYLMLQFNHEGKVIDYLERETTHYIPWPDSITKPHLR